MWLPSQPGKIRSHRSESPPTANRAQTNTTKEIFPTIFKTAFPTCICIFQTLFSGRACLSGFHASLGLSGSSFRYLFIRIFDLINSSMRATRLLRCASLRIGCSSAIRGSGPPSSRLSFEELYASSCMGWIDGFLGLPASNVTVGFGLDAAVEFGPAQSTLELFPAGIFLCGVDRR